MTHLSSYIEAEVLVIISLHAVICALQALCHVYQPAQNPVSLTSAIVTLLQYYACFTTGWTEINYFL